MRVIVPEPGADPPYVSVVLPVYNMERYIGEALESVLNQTFRDSEVIVVDDGSTDGTPKILDRYADRVRVIRQENRGCPAALNRGIREARGTWIAWISADDAWEPTKLERQIHVVHSVPDVGMVYTDYVYIDKDGNVLSAEHFPCPPTRRKTLLRLIRRCFVNGSSTLIRKDVFDRIGLYDEAEKYIFDWDMDIRIALAFRLANVPEPLVRYRIHPGQNSANQDRVERESRRVASRSLRRMGPILGAEAALFGFHRQVRTFPAYVRRSMHRRSIRRQLLDLIEWLVFLVNPYTEWNPRPSRPP